MKVHRRQYTLGSLMLAIAGLAAVLAYPMEFIGLVLVTVFVAILPMLFWLGLAVIDRLSRLTASRVPPLGDAPSGDNRLRDVPVAEGIASREDHPRWLSD